MTQEAIQSATESLEGRVQHFIDGGATSFVVQVRWPGGEWSKAYGVRNLDTKDPAQPQDRVSIASITKSMVAVSVLKLVDDGLIGLDDPVNGVLESFRTTLRPPGPVTVRQLLNHTSGMPDYSEAENTDPLKQIANTRLSMQRGLELAATLPWESKNMDRFAYSNSNYLALGQLIEKLRGRPVVDVLKEEIFGPLGLQHTSLGEPDRGAPDNIHAYITDGGGERVDVTQPELLVGSPAAGVISSTQDVNTFFRALVRGQLLSPAMLDEMKKKAGSGDYGLGLRQFPDACSGDVRYGHAGSAFGYISISITSADGGSQIAMAMTMPPLPWQDPATDRRVELLQTQMEQAAQEALDRLCQ